MDLKEKIERARKRVELLERTSKLESILTDPRVGRRIIGSALQAIAERREGVLSVHTRVWLARTRHTWAHKGDLAVVTRRDDSGAPVRKYVWLQAPEPTETELDNSWTKLSMRDRLVVYEDIVSSGYYMPVETDGRAIARAPADSVTEGSAR